jgi:hypothetical protein
MQVMAEKLANYDPAEAQWRISFAYATRRAESIEKAREILLNGLDSHPEEPTIHFNPACYECQLGNFAAVKTVCDQCNQGGSKIQTDGTGQSRFGVALG